MLFMEIKGDAQVFPLNLDSIKEEILAMKFSQFESISSESHLNKLNVIIDDNNRQTKGGLHN